MVDAAGQFGNAVRRRQIALHPGHAFRQPFDGELDLAGAAFDETMKPRPDLVATDVVAFRVWDVSDVVVRDPRDVDVSSRSSQSCMPNETRSPRR